MTLEQRLRPAQTHSDRAVVLDGTLSKLVRSLPNCLAATLFCLPCEPVHTSREAEYNVHYIAGIEGEAVEKSVLQANGRTVS